jgi:hypothetical protein
MNGDSAVTSKNIFWHEFNWVSILIRVLVTIVVFLLSYERGGQWEVPSSRFKQTNSNLNINAMDTRHIKCPPSNSSLLSASLPLSVETDRPCDEVETVNMKTTYKARSQHLSQKHSEYDPLNICSVSANADASSPAIVALNTLRSYLYLWKGDIAAAVFNWLHNPSSPAKAAFILTSRAQWGSNKMYQPLAMSLEEQDAERAAGAAGAAGVGLGLKGTVEGRSYSFRDPFLSENCDQLYLTRTGSRSNQPNKCVAVVKVPSGHESLLKNSHRIGYTALLTNQYQADFHKEASLVEEKDLLYPVLQELGLADAANGPRQRVGTLHTVEELMRTKLGSPIDGNGQRRTAIVMVANEGVLDLLLNWLCSAKAIGLDVSNVVVYVGTAESAAVIERGAPGAHAIYSPVLGSMPRNAAGGYLDNTFSRMMWFKTASVYLTLRLGFHVLFQDVDLVWLLNPVPYLHSLGADIAFMDDGARTPRYTPYFVNSGFYYIRHNNVTLYWQEQMFKSGPADIAQSHSHQSMLIKHLSEAVALWGLRVEVLSR